MAKKFDIHEWQSKQRLAEQDDSPEKTDRLLNYQGGAVLGPKIAMLLPEDYSIKNFARDVGGVIEVEFGKHNIKTFLNELEDYFSIYGDDERSLGEEMDEQNVTGTGASFSAGNSPAYATPKAFGKKKDKDIEVLGYKKVNELKAPYRKSGYMGYSEPVSLKKEQEGEEISKDAKLLADHPLLDKINTKDEWIDVMMALMNHATTISTVSDSIKKSTLLSMVKTIGKKDV